MNIDKYRSELFFKGRTQPTVYFERNSRPNSGKVLCVSGTFVNSLIVTSSHCERVPVAACQGFSLIIVGSVNLSLLAVSQYSIPDN